MALLFEMRLEMKNERLDARFLLSGARNPGAHPSRFSGLSALPLRILHRVGGISRQEVSLQVMHAMGILSRGAQQRRIIGQRDEDPAVSPCAFGF